jgi:hypothetical protein
MRNMVYEYLNLRPATMTLKRIELEDEAEVNNRKEHPRPSLAIAQVNQQLRNECLNLCISPSVRILESELFDYLAAHCQYYMAARKEFMHNIHPLEAEFANLAFHARYDASGSLATLDSPPRMWRCFDDDMLDGLSAKKLNQARSGYEWPGEAGNGELGITAVRLDLVNKVVKVLVDVGLISDNYLSSGDDDADVADGLGLLQLSKGWTFDIIRYGGEESDSE